MSDPAEPVWPPPEQDVVGPRRAQDALGIGLAVIVTVGALLIGVGIAWGLILLLSYFGVPHEPLPR